jgi:hypothetical protein
MEVEAAPLRAAGPAVSVIIPTWNAADAIERALASVLDVRDQGIECVVIDDASTDGTAARVAAIAASDPRVVLVAVPVNAGVSNARNRGLDVARGEWLTFLDADDRFVGGGVSALLAAARRTSALAVVGQQVWSDGRRTWRSPLYDIPDVTAAGRKSLATHPGLVYHASPHAKLFCRAIVEDLRFAGRVGGDQPWVLQGLLRAGDRVEVIADTVYEWTRAGPGRGNAPSITATARSSARRGIDATATAAAALDEVRTEARRVLPGSDADRVASTYAERLLRSDLGVHLELALRRRDPAVADLLQAIDHFVAGIGSPLPRPVSGALASDILVPPLWRWPSIGADARTAYWSLFDSASAADPRLDEAAPLGSRVVLRLARRSNLRAATVVATGVMGVRLMRRAARRVRRAAARR